MADPIPYRKARRDLSNGTKKSKPEGDCFRTFVHVPLENVLRLVA